MSGDEDFTLGLVVGIVIGLALAGAITAICWNGDITALKDEGVKNGKAEYFFDSSFEKQWRWKP